MRNVVLVCYWVVMHFREIADRSSIQQRERGSVCNCSRVQLTFKGEVAIRYVFSWVLLWLAFRKVNHGENCSQSCLEDTRGGLEASYHRRVNPTPLWTGPWVPTVMGELGLRVFSFLNWKSPKSSPSFPLSGEASATVFWGSSLKLSFQGVCTKIEFSLKFEFSDLWYFLLPLST